MEYEFSFNDLKDKVDLIDYVKFVGYRENDDKSTKRQLVFDGAGEKIMIMRHTSTNDLIYKNLNNSADKGNIINFVANRVNGTLNSGMKTKEDYKKTAEILKSFLKIPKEAKLPLNEIKETKNYYFNYKLFKPQTLKDTTFLESRGITKETLLSPHFKGKIINCQDYDFKGKINFSGIKTGFPMTDASNEIVGLDMRDANSKKLALGSKKSEAFFVSNSVGKPKNFVLAESPLDLLSYHQIKGSTENRYFSSNGNITDFQLELIKNSLEKGKYEKIVLATDNDFGGYGMDLKIVAKFNPEIKSVNVYKERVEIEMLKEPDSIIKLFNLPSVKDVINTCLKNSQLENVIILDKAPDQYKDWNAVINPTEKKKSCLNL